MAFVPRKAIRDRLWKPFEDRGLCWSGPTDVGPDWTAPQLRSSFGGESAFGLAESA